MLHDDVRFTDLAPVRYDCCITMRQDLLDHGTANLPSDIYLLTTQPALHARLRHQGYYAASTDPEGRRSIAATYSFLLDEWITASSYQFGGTCVMEIYDIPHSRCAPDTLACDIYSPIV